MDEDVSNEERQTLEIEMLQAIYPTELVLDSQSSGVFSPLQDELIP
jgi:hypothetical protein